MQPRFERPSSDARDPSAEPALSPAEFAVALTELYSRPSLQSLCDAAAHLGATALGRTWVALLSRSASDDPLRPSAAAGPDQGRWPVEPPPIAAVDVAPLISRFAKRALTAGSFAALFDTTLPADTAIALQDALRPSVAALAPVVVDGQGSGLVLVATHADVPVEAVTALAEHTAAAMRTLLQIDRARTHGDRDAESGLLGRAAVERTAAQEIMRARRYSRPFSLILITPADSAAQSLRDLGRRLQELLRDTDSVGRLDDERFVVLMPETDRDAAHSVVRRMQQAIPTARIGAANHPTDGTTWEALLAAADRPQRIAELQPTPPVVGQPWQTAAAESHDPIAARFPQQAGPPPRLRDMFPNFKSRAVN